MSTIRGGPGLPGIAGDPQWALTHLQDCGVEGTP